MTNTKLIIALKEQIKIHERAVDDLHWGHDRGQVLTRIAVYQKVIEMINGPATPDIDDNTPDCNCKQHRAWHWCPFHNWCNPSTRVGV